MARVYLTSCFHRTPGDARCLNEINRLATCQSLDRIREHSRIDQPDEADLIIFAELADYGGHVQNRILGDPVFRAYPERSVHFNPRLKEPPIIPGIYGSARKRWVAQGHACTGHYLETSLERDYIQPMIDPGSEYLFSFCGSAKTWNGRRQILQLRARDALLIDSSVGDRLSPDEYRSRYVQSLRASHFVLCPRGIGPASLRVFEVLKAGRVPVVIADDWEPPKGPDWNAFSIRIPESDIAAIPEILRSRHSEAAEMGRRALSAHEDWFAADVSFQTIVEWALDLQRARASAKARRHRAIRTLEYRGFRMAARARNAARRLTR